MLYGTGSSFPYKSLVHSFVYSLSGFKIFIEDCIQMPMVKMNGENVYIKEKKMLQCGWSLLCSVE